MKTITKHLTIKALLAVPALIMFLFSNCELKAQDTINSHNKEIYDEEYGLINWVEVLPEFPGGNAALYEFIKQNLTYPKSAKEQGIEGIVYVWFIVENDGSITNIKIVQGLNEELDAEALRVVNLMPNWKPGYRGPHPIGRVPYTLPIMFKLDKE